MRVTKERKDYKTIIFNFRKIYKLNIKEHEKEHLYVKAYRILSVPFISISLLLRLSPNLITLISFLSSLLSGIFYLQFNIIPAILLYELSKILDYTDGCTGKIRNMQSKFGAVIDIISDKFNIIFSTIAISIGAYLKHSNTTILFLGVSLLCIWVYREWACLIIDKITGYNQTVQNTKNRIKNKLSIPSKIITTFFDIMLFLLPFSVLFPIESMIKFFIVYICTELFRLIIDLLLFSISTYVLHKTYTQNN